MIRWAKVLAKSAAGQLLAAALIVGGPVGAMAAELLMIEEQGCPWCRRWHAEIGVAYPRTPEGQRAPLRRVDISEASRLNIALARPVTYSPTFILVEDHREVGRIVGHPGPDFFWGLLADLLAKLPETPTVPEPQSPSVTRISTGEIRAGRAHTLAGDGTQL